MGGLSPVHLGLVLVIALLVFGPKKLPEIGRELGQAIREFKKASREVVDSFQEATSERPSYSHTAAAPYVTEASGYPYAPQAPLPEESAPAAGPSVPAGPPPGTVDRSASALAGAPAAGGTPPGGETSVEPAREAAAPERNT